MRALLIEDEVQLQEQIRSQLEAEHFQVDVTGNGKEGLYFASEYPVDIAIIDIGLPELSGIDIIKALRKQGSTLPILVLTARERWQDKVDGLEVIMGRLRKKLDPDGQLKPIETVRGRGDRFNLQ